MKVYKAGAGSHISNVCEKVVAMANESGDSVEFTFNDIKVTVQPGESTEAVQQRWQTDTEAAREAWLKSPERAKQEAERAAELARKRAAVMVETAQTEAEMRAAKEVWPLTEKQLLEYIASLVDRQHEYGTCVYALSLAASAAFNYVAGQLGVTGFQASCADLDFLRRTRSIKGPFILLKAEDALFPQSLPREKLDRAEVEWLPWLKEEAKKKLTESGGAHPAVLAHWKELAGLSTK